MNRVTSSGDSQFLFNVDAEATTLKAAEAADEQGLWVADGNGEFKTKVTFGEHVGALGKTGELTKAVNVYRRAKGMIHGSPGNP